MSARRTNGLSNTARLRRRASGEFGFTISHLRPQTARGGVSFEDRQDLLGHRSGRITTHYSQAELANLIEAAEKVYAEQSRKSPAITWLRRKTG